MHETAVDKPVRVGVFSTVPQAERAVAALFAAGFSTRDDVSGHPGHVPSVCPPTPPVR